MGALASDDWARLAYLVLLGTAVGGWFLAESRGNLGRSARQALIWGFIFLGVIAAVGLWPDIRRIVLGEARIGSGGQVTVPLSSDGHYHLTLAVNGVPVDFLVDTGASDIVLSPADARSAGIAPEGLQFIGTAETANGPVRVARVTLDTLALGAMVETGRRVLVNEAEMDGSLLGMAYLERFGRIEISGGALILTP